MRAYLGSGAAGDTARAGTDASFRTADAAALAAALVAARADTLATFAALARTACGLAVPERPTLNPPLWELGHLGWFQEYWVARNPDRAAGAAADPDAPRTPPVRADADSLYDSSRVAQATRWSLPLPDAEATRDDLAHQLDRTLALVEAAGPDDASLYFFRLVLAHEDMHHEAALYMAQALGRAIDEAHDEARDEAHDEKRAPARDVWPWRPAVLHDDDPDLAFDAAPFALGRRGPGFAFDNELDAHEVDVPAFAIDARVVRWSEYLPFVDDGGYRDDAWWSDAGRAWRAAARAEGPRFVARDGAGWRRVRFGAWAPLDLGEPACHLTLFEAEAWCRWAGRRLPTEAEWERAAVAAPDAFRWGDVWEWTATAFAPYPGFVAHPYRDYSAPWFGDRTVLRGASFLTQPRMRDARYRNFFGAARNDVPAGFRTCRL